MHFRKKYENFSKIYIFFQIGAPPRFPFLPIPLLPPVLLAGLPASRLKLPIALPVAANLGADPVHGGVQACLLQLALPDNDDTPALRLQHPPDHLVPLLVPGNLRHPELRVSLRYSIAPAAPVPMPETAVHENRGPVSRQHDIRRPRQAPHIRPIPESPPPQRTAQRHLRLRRVGVNRRHVIVALDGI